MNTKNSMNSETIMRIVKAAKEKAIRICDAAKRNTIRGYMLAKGKFFAMPVKKQTHRRSGSARRAGTLYSTCCCRRHRNGQQHRRPPQSIPQPMRKPLHAARSRSTEKRSWRCRTQNPRRRFWTAFTAAYQTKGSQLMSVAYAEKVGFKGIFLRRRIDSDRMRFQ